MKLASDPPESSYDQSIIYADQIVEERGQQEMIEQSVTQDVHSPVDFDEVVTVTSNDSELRNQSSAGIEHTYYEDENNAEVVDKEETYELFETNFAKAF